MIIEFSVENYRSFYERRTLSLEASKIKELEDTNVIKKGKIKILRFAAIYGANSSGKSNLIMAFLTMRQMVTFSVKLNDSEGYNSKDYKMYDPFLLSTKSYQSPTTFEIIFLKDNLQYRYGFKYSESAIVDEWLFVSEIGKTEKHLFIRTTDGIDVSEKDFPEGIDLEKRTTVNRLFLSLVAQFNGKIANSIMAFFAIGYQGISGIYDLNYKTYTEFMFHNQKDECEDALRFLRELNLGFQDINTKSKKQDDSSKIHRRTRGKAEDDFTEDEKITFFTLHNKYDEDGSVICRETFSLEERESEGTIKLIRLAGPLFDTLRRGATLIIDELDVKMHPLISQHIIELFNNPKTNKHNAQLIFTTHDTHLLSSKLLRRDQIWFAEKDTFEQTDLYSMDDIALPDGTKPRNDSNYEKNYIAGRYGAIPYITND